jgi:hypothetical protein
VDCLVVTGSCGCNFMDFYICEKDNSGMSLFVEEVNLWVMGTHEFHES